MPLLAALDRRLGLTALLSRQFVDVRRSKSVEHGFTELVRQRVFSIAHGYADCNDAARIGDDPLFKLACGRWPGSATALASQLTLSRFERGHGGREGRVGVCGGESQRMDDSSSGAHCIETRARLFRSQ